jgi:predicted GH43/DUF377 family glycosyl hydrolase
VLYEDDRFYLYERTAGPLRPHHCYVGLLESEDGVHFRYVSDQPVPSPEMVGYRYGSVQDPRVVKIEDTYYMTFAFRRFALSIYPTGLGVPVPVISAVYRPTAFAPVIEQKHFAQKPVNAPMVSCVLIGV